MRLACNSTEMLGIYDAVGNDNGHIDSNSTVLFK